MVSFVLVFVCYVSFFKTDAIVSAFIGIEDSSLFSYSTKSFRIFSLSFLIVGFNILISGYFVAVEKPFEAIIISLSRGLFALIIVLKIMVYLFGDFGIWISPLVSESVVFVISLIFILNHRRKNSIMN